MAGHELMNQPGTCLLAAYMQLSWSLVKGGSHWTALLRSQKLGLPSNLTLLHSSPPLWLRRQARAVLTWCHAWIQKGRPDAVAPLFSQYCFRALFPYSPGHLWDLDHAAEAAGRPFLNPSGNQIRIPPSPNQHFLPSPVFSGTCTPRPSFYLHFWMQVGETCTLAVITWALVMVGSSGLLLPCSSQGWGWGRRRGTVQWAGISWRHQQHLPCQVFPASLGASAGRGDLHATAAVRVWLPEQQLPSIAPA